MRVDGGSVIRVSEKGLPQGTTITVTDLFFNTPARFKFMKSRATERNAAIDTVERLALAHDIALLSRPMAGWCSTPQAKD